ncbi:exonuclease SbcCD subunit D [Nocardioides marmoriginsengisoli]|uniref:Nuclease SbcCD subunit D n=1 Tax=Nocardioides marmoriginsengisoli TaxID=661483 RepID=A0A3N0CQI2_9ACTN|nr:exonuclease SbcCD subunit D [Nocardioides marmoriginsengisoli]RNL65715.1 exonuclease SbcCD subunit D [Nocardioides marmoriginsengisoli]
MRILHTSDWHLGRQFHGQGMLTHQADFVDHLLEVVEREQVDLVVVAGDVYDRALPPVDAVALADDAFTRLAASRARVVLTSGNHDSAQRLGFNARLADAAGFHLRTHLDRIAEPVLIPDEHGQVAVYGIPYLEPDQVKRAWDLPARSHHAALSAAMDLIRADFAARPDGTRSVVLAHAFVIGGSASDSERDIAVGGVSAVPTGTFDGIDYVALGHLHGRHTLTESIRYSGSPLAYSFSEAAHVKGCWLIDLGADGITAASFIEAPVPRRLARLTGTIDELLHDPRYADHEDSWVQATLTDPVRPVQAMIRLQARFPHAIALQFAPAGERERAARTLLEGRTDHEVALQFVAAMRSEPATDEESDLLRDACECAARDPEVDVVVGA